MCTVCSDYIWKEGGGLEILESVSWREKDSVKTLEFHEAWGGDGVRPWVTREEGTQCSLRWAWAQQDEL